MSNEEIVQRPLPGQDFWAQGLEPSFFSRVYLRSAQLSGVLALMLFGLDQRAMALGLIAGQAVALFSTWTTEMAVRVLFNEGSLPGVKLALAAFVKLPVMLGGLLFVAWAAFNKHIDAFGVVGGVLLLHAVLFGLMVGRALSTQMRAQSGTQ
jgi:hypothetical protein